jgi:hypothetical protein
MEVEPLELPELLEPLGHQVLLVHRVLLALLGLNREITL